VRDLLVDGARYTQPAGLGDPLQARRDVDTVAQEVPVALDHVPDRDPDAEAHLSARRIGKIAGAQVFLHVDGAAHRFDGAREFGKNGVAGGIENAAAKSSDEVLED